MVPPQDDVPGSYPLLGPRQSLPVRLVYLRTRRVEIAVESRGDLSEAVGCGVRDVVPDFAERSIDEIGAVDSLE